MDNISSSWQFWAFLAAIFAALTAVFAKIGVDEVNANFATFLRTIVVIIALAVILGFRNEFESLGNISPRGGLFLILSGLATGASWLCYFQALKIGNVMQVAPIDKLSVVFVALISVIFLGEKLPLAGWSGIGLITVGAVLVATA